MCDPWKGRHFLLYIYIILFIFGCTGSSLPCGLLSSCVVCGLLIAIVSLVAEHRLRGTRGLQQLQLLGCRAHAEQLRHSGLVAPWHMEPSCIRDGTRVSCIGRQILYRGATREAPRAETFLLIFVFRFSAFFCRDK